jgi:hypothetical protein
MSEERQTIPSSVLHLSSFIVHRSILAVLCVCWAANVASAQLQTPYGAKPMAFDAARLRDAGLRAVVGKHLTLYTDVPSSPAVDELPQVFDAAVPQWAAYFGKEKTLPRDWHMTGFLIREKERFARAGVIPAAVPEFAHGYSLDYELWMFDQPSDYYRRHLLLHEGTHGFMNTVLGSCGAPWFMEGLAELLGTHRWHEGRLTLGYVPRTSDEVPRLGRVQFVHDAAKADRLRSADEIVNDAVRGYIDNESYAFGWAFALFLDRHPKYQARFHRLQAEVRNLKFNDEFRKTFRADLPTLGREWLVFANELEYGVDVARTAIDFRPGHPLPTAGMNVTIAADRGWQSSGVKLEAGKTYRLRAAGRYEIAETVAADGTRRTWPCEPGGVTIRYYRGRPLGMLLGAVEPDALPVGTPPPMLQPIPLGLEATLKPERAGTLYLRVNDSNGELTDNTGTLTVEIAPGP